MLKRAMDVGAPLPDVAKLMSPTKPAAEKRPPKKEHVESQVSTTPNLEKLLASDGLVGQVMNKVIP